MPRRQRRRNPDNVIDMDEKPTDDEAPADEPTKKKKRGIPPWLKWTGATALGAVVGGVAIRKYDGFMGNRSGGDGDPQPNPNIPPPTMPPMSMPMPMPMPIPFPMPSFGATAPIQNAPKKTRRRKSVAELKAELKARQVEDSEAAAEDFWEED